MFRFVLGLVTGVAVGVAAATISRVESGQDIRAEFERIRGDLEKRDFDALGAHLEERFKELQTSLEERFAQIRGAADADAAADDAAAAAVTAADAAEDAAADADAEADDATPARNASATTRQDGRDSDRRRGRLSFPGNRAAGRRPPQGSGAITSIGTVVRPVAER